MIRLEEDDAMTLTERQGRWYPGRLPWRSAAARKELELTLATDATWSARVPRHGLEVRCLAGTVLVTAEGDVEDHVLTAGATLVARRPGRVAVWALEEARVRVEERAPTEDRAAGRAGGLAAGRRASLLRSSG